MVVLECNLKGKIKTALSAERRIAPWEQKAVEGLTKYKLFV
jgi:hypothetical protein